MANTDILTRAGKTTALAGSEYDSNVDSMCGICEEVTGSTHTIAYTDQNKTIQYNNATSVAVTLPDAATIIASLDTTAFKIVLKNIGAGAVTVTSAVANELDGATTLVLNQYDSAAIHSNSAGAAWNIITKDMDVVDINGGTIDGATITSPKIVTDIQDSNGNELLNLTATGSAVNELTLANAATGSNPTVSATGDDTDIGIALTAKGTGGIDLNPGTDGVTIGTGNGIVGVIDDDTMATATDTTLATSESVKAYVDSITSPTILSAASITGADPFEITTAIPASATHIEITITGMSLTSPAASINLQVGHSTSTYLTSGYRGDQTDGIELCSTYDAGSDVIDAMIIMNEVATDEWFATVRSQASGASSTGNSSGYIDVANELTSLRIDCPSASETFDAGSVRVTYY